MKILFVCSGNSKNGISPFIKDQSESLTKNSIGIDFFFIQGKGTIGYLKNLPSLKKTIDLYKYDLIHAHYGLSGMLSILQRKIPVIITFHGSDINYQKNNSISSFATLFSKWNIFVSQKLYEKLYFKPKRNFEIIPCGVDFKIFNPIDKNEAKELLGLKIDERYILFPSSFSNEIKNYSLAKKALENINNVTLLELKGYSRREVNLLLNASELLLITSFSEGSPQIIKEAMACNCPIVSTDVGDVKEVIGDTEGCFITSFDPKEISEKIKMALDFGKRTDGREKILKLGLDSDTIAKKIINIYQNVLNNKI